jgi:hypothetical protein
MKLSEEMIEMNASYSHRPDQNISIQLEIVPEEAGEEVADVDEAARSMVDYIRSNGYTVTPKNTGKMGGPVFEIFMQAAIILRDNREVIATIGASLELLAATLGLIKDHTEQREERKNRPVLVPASIEITMPTSQGPWTIKAPDAETAIKIARELPTTEPEKIRTITPHEPIRVRPKVVKKRRHHRH